MIRSEKQCGKSLFVALAATSLLLGLTCATHRVATAQEQFLRGDINADGRISISDATMLQNWLFNGGTIPTCLDAADIYAPKDYLYPDDGNVIIHDEIVLLLKLYPPRSYLEYTGNVTSLPAPFPVVGPDPTSDELSCESYDVVPPVETDDLVRLGDVLGNPGEQVRIPVYVTNHVPVDAYQLVIAYDPDAIEITPVDGGVHEESRLHWTGGFYESIVPSCSSSNPFCARPEFFSVMTFPEEGLLVVVFMPFLAETPYVLPPGEDQLVFYILGTVSPGAAPGTTVSLEPMNGLDGEGFAPFYMPSLRLRNELSSRGSARYVSVEPQLEGSILRIVVDQMFFRGDSNGDENIDISDVLTTLGFLFLGEESLPCLDAADANDNGDIDISDGIYTLAHLFLGGREIPEPSSLKGHDPTGDALDCAANP